MKLNKKILILCCTLMLSTSFADAKMTKKAHELYKQATYLEHKQDYNNAIKYLEQAIAINGADTVLYTKIAGLYYNIGNNQEAINYYKKALQLNPADGFIYVTLGHILQSTGDYENEYKSYKQAL